MTTITARHAAAGITREPESWSSALTLKPTRTAASTVTDTAYDASWANIGRGRHRLPPGDSGARASPVPVSPGRVKGTAPEGPRGRVASTTKRPLGDRPVT